jgi:hypothetical protein
VLQNKGKQLASSETGNAALKDVGMIIDHLTTFKLCVCSALGCCFTQPCVVLIIRKLLGDNSQQMFAVN